MTSTKTEKIEFLTRMEVSNTATTTETTESSCQQFWTSIPISKHRRHVRFLTAVNLKATLRRNFCFNFLFDLCNAYLNYSMYARGVT